MQVEKILPVRSLHNGCFYANLFIFRDIFDDKFFKSTKNLVYKIFDETSTDTFLTHKTIFKLGDQTKKILSHKQNNRRQHVLWDLISHPDYYFNTKDSIKAWADSKLKELNSLIFYKITKIFESVEPLNAEADKWIPMRAHGNVLHYDHSFQMHKDSDPIWYDVELRNARLFSCTIYLDSVKLGGELWTETGFVYKPESNTALMLNGNQIWHGVNNNMDPRKTVRKAFTIRWAHADDLFLPGHPSKTLYKVEYAE